MEIGDWVKYKDYDYVRLELRDISMDGKTAYVQNQGPIFTVSIDELEPYVDSNIAGEIENSESKSDESMGGLS